MSRPTLHLTNLPSKSQHGPGRRLCAMALPRRWERGDGAVPVLMPDSASLRAVRAGRITIEAYRKCYEQELTEHSREFLAPGVLGRWNRGSRDVVRDGDTLFCACARPDSPKRTHPCHLEWLAPFLVEAGWDVVLYGRRLTWHETPGVVAEVIWADTTAPYPGGWEAAPTPRPSAARCDETAHYRSQG